MINFREQYENIEIPKELDLAIKQGIKKGKREMKKRKNKLYLGTISLVASLLIVFILGVNISTTFAKAISQMPGGERIVKILTFNHQGKIEGGQLGDGQDIKDFDVEKKGQWEELTIEFDGVEGINNYTIIPISYPNGLLLEFSGTRSFTGKDKLPDLTEYQLIDNFYPLITLDDQLFRFIITFKKDVDYQIKEISTENKIVISVKEKEERIPTKLLYSLRTASYPFHEEVGHIESILKFEYFSENARMLGDVSGMLFIEEGLYESKAQALARKHELKELGFEYNLYIEERDNLKIPEKIVE
ncbi:DUF4179 domain-containing protein [Anaerobranca gottschalkii]|uniref:DUF4179 domain-containing protein n=1 Tax=Anaerobranca gottschalkii DSM 13577 TaxID=1120990 RepID=A0A1I0ADA7_9FIRM|nr:DUF4179 domain-containing protein [Anaerobranca gottschalkii]SES92186.1 hypothetical protein SAMN03080614_102019 [Anaerobranca gottschalkii DSM 13577]